MDKRMPYTNNFLKGLTNLTGLPLKRIQEYKMDPIMNYTPLSRHENKK